MGGIAAITLSQEAGVVGALAVPAFTAGLRGGVRFMSLALSTEMLTLVAVHYARVGPLTAAQATDALVWIVTGLGLGPDRQLPAVRGAASHRRPADPLPRRTATDQAAVEPLRQSRFRTGPDHPRHADRRRGPQRAARRRHRACTSTEAITSPRWWPVRAPRRSTKQRSSHWRTMRGKRTDQLISDSTFALPLLTDSGPVAVITGLLPATFGMNANEAGLRERLDTLRANLAPLAVQLDTAMLFTRLRDAATADERRRLAREMHDGVAQDIASLGYLVDALAAAPASDAQAEQLRRLRERISGRRLAGQDLGPDPAHRRPGQREPRGRHQWSGAPPQRELRHARSGSPSTSGRHDFARRSRPSCCASRRRP